MQEARPETPVAPFVALFSAIVTVVAVIAWDEALDFDPCDNVIKHASVDCVEPGLSGILVGALVIFIGGSITVGALRNGLRVYGRWTEPVLFVWLGLAMAITGGAIAYAQWSLGL